MHISNAFQHLLFVMYMFENEKTPCIYNGLYHAPPEFLCESDPGSHIEAIPSKNLEVLKTKF